MTGWSVASPSVGFARRRLLSTLAPATALASLVVGVVTYQRMLAVTVGAAPFEFPLIALIATCVLGLEFSLCGYVILRQTANRVGWILQATGILFSFIWVGLSLPFLMLPVGTSGWQVG